MLTINDRTVLRELALKYASYASLEIQNTKRDLWKRLNSFKMQRPLVLFDQLPWHELDVDGFLICRVEDPYWRNVENMIRMELYKWEHMPADMVLNPYLILPRPFEYHGYGVSSHVTHAVTDPRNSVVGQYYENQFYTIDDVQRIQVPRTARHPEWEIPVMEEAKTLFDGIIDFKFSGMSLHLGFWDFISQWMGVEDTLYNLYDNPELMHAMMERLTVVTEQMILQTSEQGLFDVTSNLCHCSHTFSEKSDSDRFGSSQNAWTFGLAQLFSSVSPAMTAEFEIPYMQRLFPYFGDVYYGCCDRLDDRLELICERLPNVRKISCSPWSNPYIFSEKLPHNFVMSNKPNPAFFAEKPFSLDSIKNDLKNTIAAAKSNSTNLEFIFKDVSTVNYKPQNLWDTAKMAVELMEREYS